MYDDVRAVLEGAEIDRARERRVDDEREATLLREVADRPQVEYAAGRVDGRLHEDGAGLLAHALPPGARLHGIDERDVDAHRRELLGEQKPRAAVDPVAREEVVAGAEQG